MAGGEVREGHPPGAGPPGHRRRHRQGLYLPDLLGTTGETGLRRQARSQREAHRRPASGRRSLYPPLQPGGRLHRGGHPGAAGPGPERRDRPSARPCPTEASEAIYRARRRPAPSPAEGDGVSGPLCPLPVPAGRPRAPVAQASAFALQRSERSRQAEPLRRPVPLPASLPYRQRRPACHAGGRPPGGDRRPGRPEARTVPAEAAWAGCGR